MEEEVNYASVVFKNPKTSPPKASREDTIYSTVNIQGNGADPARVTKDKKSDNCSNNILVFCLGILCVILMSAIISLCVYFTKAANEKDNVLINKLQGLRHNQTALLAGNHNLTTLIENLSQAYNTLESNLTTENLQLKTENLNLEAKLENLKREVRRVCKPCQDGWRHDSTSCYAIVDPEPANQRSWKDAQDDCRGKNSDLAVINSPEEQTFIREHSWGGSDRTNGYWIGLTSTSGIWRWVDGRNLTDGYGITPRGDGQCATSVQYDNGWDAVDCTAKRRWICEMKDLIG